MHLFLSLVEFGDIRGQGVQSNFIGFGVVLFRLDGFNVNAEKLLDIGKTEVNKGVIECILKDGEIVFKKLFNRLFMSLVFEITSENSHNFEYFINRVGLNSSF